MIRILYDNRAQQGFLAGWGFSCLVEAEEKILFDAGWDPHVLLYNMKKFGIKLEDITTIVISHAHWDHSGALPAVLSSEKTVYVPHSFSPNLKREIAARAHLVEVTKKMHITDSVFTTGELGDTIKEQSLCIKSKNGSYIVTGCAHPGLESIISACNPEHYAVIGGFHGFSNLERLQDAFMICPCHCTQHMNKIEKLYPLKTQHCAAGCVIGDAP